MKAWQKGYEIAYLKGIEKRFTDYNAVVLSPFAQMKKNKVADLLDNDKLDIKIDGHKESLIPTNIARNAVHVRAYSDVDLGIRAKGERMIDNPVGDKEEIKKQINKYKENMWMTINSQYKMGNEIAKELDFEKIGIKINSFSDIINVYIKQQTDKKMDIRFISPLEAENIRMIGTVKEEDLTGMMANLSKQHLVKLFANHYSNYNKKKSWSAVSLRGFDKDPAMIEKPSEMNDKWKNENEGKEFKIQNTSLRKTFEPYITNILKYFPCDKERVRLMKLERDGGELQRHTDQTDKDLGITDGKIMRFHVPIFTNDKVIFSSWDWKGARDNINMKTGEIWYLDIRKPHMAVNKGITSRVHLVIDCIANEEMYNLML